MQFRGLHTPIAELASRQHGVVSRVQLQRLGIGTNAIDNGLRTGRLHRLHPGVYAVGHRVVTREGRWMAAVLAAGTGAVLSHRSAAALWNLRSNSGAAIEITAPRSTRSRGPIQRHCARLPADEVAVNRSIPLTTVRRTLFDLAAVVPPNQLERAMREAEVLRLYDRLSLPALLFRYPHHRGNVAIRACLDRLDRAAGFTRSELEDRFVGLLRRAGIPRPRLNARLEISGAWIEVDCLWSHHRLVVELDGHAVHGTRASFESDRERDRRLQAAGWRVVRITWRQLREEPATLVRDLHTLLAG
jgi:very-short-patch-repair endonuclease